MNRISLGWHHGTVGTISDVSSTKLQLKSLEDLQVSRTVSLKIRVQALEIYRILVSRKHPI